MFRKYILPWLVFFIYRLWTWSWRKTIVCSSGLLTALEEKKPVIFAHWHGDELVIIHLVPIYKIATMTSKSKDGELVDFVLRKLGGATSRGSSTRGGIGALKGLIRLLRSGNHNASMAVDGPKGPLHQVKLGVFELSKLTDALIVPVGAASSSAKVFEKSWNKARLPWPFSKVVVVFTEPLPAVPRVGDFDMQENAKKLRTSIFDASQQALKKLDEI